MTSHYFDFDAVTHSTKRRFSFDTSIAGFFNCSGFMGNSRINRCQELETEFRSGTWAKRIYLERLLSSCRAPLNMCLVCLFFCQVEASNTVLLGANHERLPDVIVVFGQLLGTDLVSLLYSMIIHTSCCWCIRSTATSILYVLFYFIYPSISAARRNRRLRTAPRHRPGELMIRWSVYPYETPVQFIHVLRPLSSSIHDFIHLSIYCGCADVIVVFGQLLGTDLVSPYIGYDGHIMCVCVHILDSRAGRGIPTARGMTETPRGTGHTNTSEETTTRVGGSWMTTKIGSQQKQSPEEGIPKGGPIPLHRDTTIYMCVCVCLYIYTFYR